MLAPVFAAVRPFVLQICRPVAASRQTSSPRPFAAKMCSPRIHGVEVLLKMRLAGVRISGQRNTAAGGFALTSTINPLTSNRPPGNTGVATESLLLVTIRSFQYTCPLAGSKDASELSLQT